MTERNTQYWLSLKGTRSYFSEKKEKPITEGSPYGKDFAQGATIVPRSFWFVEIQRTGGLGADPGRPYVKTDPRAIKAAKEQYQDVRNVESEFLYSTLLSTDLVPFGHLPFRTVVLPIVWKPDGYKKLRASEAREEGYLGLAGWLEKCEEMWKEKQGEKAGRMTVYQRLHRYHGLTQQHRKRYTVVYPASATYLCAAVIQKPSPDAQTKPFVSESKLYYHDTDSEEEAHYISGILNSPYLDAELKPLQSKGDFGPRDIHKKMWAFPIPFYTRQNEAHKNLAELGNECNKLTGEYLKDAPAKLREGSLGRLRGLIREKLRPQLDEIDAIVRTILT